MTARNLALEALKFYANSEVYEPDSVGRILDITDVARAAIAALEAETGKPVAWCVSLDGKVPYGNFCADLEYATAMVKAVGGTAVAMPLYTAPSPVVPQWIPVAERMPVAGCKVLVFYRNNYGHGRRTCAHYAPLHTIDASHWDDGEPDETDDGVFEPEGWWEEPTEAEQVTFIADEVTHWMPLPAAPGVPA